MSDKSSNPEDDEAVLEFLRGGRTILVNVKPLEDPGLCKLADDLALRLRSAMALVSGTASSAIRELTAKEAQEQQEDDKGKDAP